MAVSIRCGECKGIHGSVDEVQACYAEAAEAGAEIYAEAVSSWCSGGGSYHDAQLYARVITSGKTWDEYLREQDEAFAKEAEAAGTCDHGLSAALCCGSQHYPLDTYED